MAVIVTLVASTLLNRVMQPLGVLGHAGRTVSMVLTGPRLLGCRPKK